MRPEYKITMPETMQWLCTCTTHKTSTPDCSFCETLYVRYITLSVTIYATLHSVRQRSGHGKQVSSQTSTGSSHHRPPGSRLT